MNNTDYYQDEDSLQAGGSDLRPPFHRYLLLFLLVFGGIMLVGAGGMWIISRSSGGKVSQAPVVETIPKKEPVLAESSEEAPESTLVLQESSVPEESLVPEEPVPVTFTFAGDLLFDPNYAIMSTINKRGGGIGGAISPDLIELLRASDVTVINNEFPYSKRGVPTVGKTYTFRASPQSASFLTEMGVDLVTLANNHAYDYGEEALIDTFEALDSQGVTYIGAGMNSEEASASARYEINGNRISLLSATQIERLSNPDTREATSTSPGVFRCLDDKRLLSRIREEKEAGYFVIVCVHWGTENEEALDWLQLKQAPEYAEAGADLIIGCHPHILQGVGKEGGTPVFYSLGNFLFNSKTLDSCVVQAEIQENELVRVRFIPCVQKSCTVSLAGEADRSRIIAHVNDMSGGQYLDGEGYLNR